jgi:hypothetical protein
MADENQTPTPAAPAKAKVTPRILIISFEEATEEAPAKSKLSLVKNHPLFKEEHVEVVVLKEGFGDSAKDWLQREANSTLHELAKFCADKSLTKNAIKIGWLSSPEIIRASVDELVCGISTAEDYIAAKQIDAPVSDRFMAFPKNEFLDLLMRYSA